MFNKRLKMILEDEFGDLDDQDTFGNNDVTIIYFFVPIIIDESHIIDYVVDSITNILDEWIDDPAFENWEWEGRGPIPINERGLISKVNSNVATELTKLKIGTGYSDYSGYRLLFYTPFMFVEEHADELFINDFTIPHDHYGNRVAIQLSKHNNVIKKSYKIPWFIDGEYSV